jgi:hypothetical protein
MVNYRIPGQTALPDEFFNGILDFRKVVSYRGAALRLSMMICLMRLGRHNGAEAPLWNRQSHAINQLIPPKSPRYDRSGDGEVAVCLSRFCCCARFSAPHGRVISNGPGYRI